MRKTVSAAVTTGLLLVPAAAGAAGHDLPDEGPAGHSVIASLDNGLVARQDYAADGKSVTLTVLAPGTTSEQVGPVGTMEVFIAKIGPHVYQASWIEPDGAVISNGQNFHNGTEQVFFSYQGSDGKRHGEQHTGTVRIES